MTTSTDWMAGDDMLDYSKATQRQLLVPILDHRQEQRLIALALNQIIIFGLRSCAVTSIVNAMEGAGDSTGNFREALVAHLPTDAPDTALLTQQFINSDVPMNIVVAIQRLHSQSMVACSLTESFCKYPADVRERGGVHIEVLTGTWRDICALAHNVIDLLRSLAIGDNRNWSAQRLPSTLALLSECANGRSPCIDAGGCVEIPGLAERRRHARWAVYWSARLLCGVSDVDVWITDISLGGCCLKSTETLREGECIALELPAGRRLTGTVVWGKLNAYGIKLSMALVEDDELIVDAKISDAV